MFGLSGYILSIVGIVILGVVVDLVLIEGQMQKYIKNIFVVFVIFVIVAPIPTLLNSEIKFPNYNSSQIEMDKNLMENINQRKKIELENDILQHFKSKGVSGVGVEVEFESDNSSFLPKKILLNIKNLVIENNYLNINKYEVLQSLVLEVVRVEKEVIEIYE